MFFDNVTVQTLPVIFFMNGTPYDKLQGIHASIPSFITKMSSGWTSYHISHKLIAWPCPWTTYYPYFLTSTQKKQRKASQPISLIVTPKEWHGSFREESSTPSQKWDQSGASPRRPHFQPQLLVVAVATSSTARLCQSPGERRWYTRRWPRFFGARAPFKRVASPQYHPATSPCTYTHTRNWQGNTAG